MSQKVELTELADQLVGPRFKIFVVIVLVPYMYGALLVKHVAGSESLMQSISFNLYKDRHMIEEKLSVDPYLLGLCAFAACTLAFTFGNIE